MLAATMPTSQAAEGALYGEPVRVSASGTLGSGFGSSAVAAADYDGDGRVDLAVVDFTRAVNVVRNLGASGFARKVSYRTGLGSTAVTAGDFDGDGSADLAVVNAGAGTLSVLLNDGRGRFTKVGDHAVGRSALDVASGDFDDDGRLDLAVASPLGRSVTVLRNVGAGGFERSQRIGTGGGAAGLAAADFDGDGTPDLAVAVDGAIDVTSTDGALVQILLSKHDGTFRPGGSVAAGFIEGITAGDVNGDGRADVVVADIWRRAVVALPGRGDGTLGEPVPSGQGLSAVDVAMADVDGDGVLDAVAGTYLPGQAVILHGNGDGTFDEVERHAVVQGPQTVALTDLDGEGSPDVLVVGSSANVSALYHR